jgi:hypothetical protein
MSLIEAQFKNAKLVEKLILLDKFSELEKFKSSLIIPQNYSKVLDVNSQKIIEKHNIPIKTDLILKQDTLCKKISDIPILEWWLYSGLIDDPEYSVEFDDLISKETDIEIFEWWVRYNFKIVFTKNFIRRACKYNRIDILEWFKRNFKLIKTHHSFNSSELKYEDFINPNICEKYSEKYNNILIKEWNN